MTDINDLIQEFWTSSNGAGTSLLATRCLFGILQTCFHSFDVCFDIISSFVTAFDLADNNLS